MAMRRWLPGVLAAVAVVSGMTVAAQEEHEKAEIRPAAVAESPREPAPGSEAPGDGASETPGRHLERPRKISPHAR